MRKIWVSITILLGLALTGFATTDSNLAYRFGGYCMANSPGYILEVVNTIKLDEEIFCMAVNEETNRVYVGVEDGLLVIDGETDTVVTEIFPDKKLSVIAINHQTNRIYTGGSGRQIEVIDGTTNQIQGKIPDGVWNSNEIAINPVTNLVYIADWTTIKGRPDKVLVYAEKNFTLLNEVVILGSTEHLYIENVGVAVNPNTNHIYASWSGNDTLTLIDGDTCKIEKTTKFSGSSLTVTVNPFTNYVYVGSWDALNGETLEKVPIEPYVGDMRAVDSVNNLLYTTDVYNLYILNGSTHEKLANLELNWSIGSITNPLDPQHSHHFSNPVAVNSRTAKIYLAHSSAKQISVVQGVFEPEPPPEDLPSEWTLETYGVFIVLVIAAAAVVLSAWRKRRAKI